MLLDFKNRLRRRAATPQTGITQPERLVVSRVRSVRFQVPAHVLELASVGGLQLALRRHRQLAPASGIHGGSTVAGVVRLLPVPLQLLRLAGALEGGVGVLAAAWRSSRRARELALATDRLLLELDEL